MNVLNIRPVTDLRNKYPDVESDVQKGPVFFTKNGYGASVLVSLEYFQSHLSRQDLYDWSLPIFDSLPIRTPSNPPILTPSGVAPAAASQV